MQEHGELSERQAAPLEQSSAKAQAGSKRNGKTGHTQARPRKSTRSSQQSGGSAQKRELDVMSASNGAHASIPDDSDAMRALAATSDAVHYSRLLGYAALTMSVSWWSYAAFDLCSILRQ